MGANDKLAATFHPTTASHMIDAVQYPVEGDDISITERARPIINRMLAEAWDEGWQKAHSTFDPAMAGIFLNPYRSTE